MNSLSDLLWSLVRWAIPITFAGVVAAIAVGTSRINDEICARVEDVLAERFPSLQVDVQQASLNKGEGIVIHGLSLIDKPFQFLLNQPQYFMKTLKRLFRRHFSKGGSN